MQLQMLETALNDYLDNNRKISKQRKSILAIFVDSNSHLTMGELYNKAKQKHSKMSMSTIYRTVHLLLECNLVSGFRDKAGTYRYELRKECHHHLVCMKCGRIIEGTDSQVKVLQNKLAYKNHFKILHTYIEVFGICSLCLQT